MAYQIVRAVADPDSFYNKYLDYATALTDAAYDYHEAMAFYLLSIASQGLRFPLPNVPKGLRANLYLIQYGFSSVTRKSTCMDIAKDIQSRAMPGTNLPSAFTPGGLEENLARRPHAPAALFADEFSRILDQMHHQSFMSGLRGFLLTMFSDDEWEYQRTSKGRNKKTDTVKIEGSHLCIAGNVTPTLAKYLQPRDIEDGFLARFAIIWPKDYPPRKKISDLELDKIQRNHVVAHLSKIRMFCKTIAEKMNPESPDYNPDMDYVKPEPHAVLTLDSFQEELENEARNDDTITIMVERVGIMAFKLSMLVALSRVDPSKTRVLHVSQEDAIAAVTIARKWKGWAKSFAESLYESEIEKHIRRAESLLVRYGSEAPRWKIAKTMKLSKRELDEVQFTLADRGIIRLTEKRLGDSHKPSVIWVRPTPQPIEVIMQEEAEKEGG